MIIIIIVSRRILLGVSVLTVFCFVVRVLCCVQLRLHVRNLNWAFYLSGLVLIIAVILARLTKRPSAEQLRTAAAAAK